MTGQLDLFGGYRGKDMLEKAMAWRNKNMRAYSQMTVLAVEFAQKGKHFSIDYLVNEARFFMRAEGIGDGFKINNDIRAPLARIMCGEYPIIEPFIETRSSCVDTWM